MGSELKEKNIKKLIDMGLSYFREVLVRENDGDKWKLHWFSRVSDQGFCSFEYGDKPMRYLFLGETEKMFSLMGTRDHIEGEIDFME